MIMILSFNPKVYIFQAKHFINIFYGQGRKELGR